MLETVQHTVVIDPGDLVDERLVGLLERRAHVANTGIEHDDVEIAAEGLDGLLQRRGHAGLVRYVNVHVGRTHGPRGFGAVRDVGNNNARAMRDERFGHRLADAGRATGDKRRHVLQRKHVIHRAYPP